MFNVHTYIHSSIPPYIHKYIYACIHTYIYTYIQAYIHAQTVKPVYRFLWIRAKMLKPVYRFLGSTGLSCICSPYVVFELLVAGGPSLQASLSTAHCLVKVTPSNCQGAKLKPQPGEKFGTRFLLQCAPQTPPNEPKNGTCAGPKPKEEGRVGGGVQITPP